MIPRKLMTRQTGNYQISNKVFRRLSDEAIGVYKIALLTAGSVGHQVLVLLTFAGFSYLSCYNMNALSVVLLYYVVLKCVSAIINPLANIRNPRVQYQSARSALRM